MCFIIDDNSTDDARRYEQPPHIDITIKKNNNTPISPIPRPHTRALALLVLRLQCVRAEDLG